MDSRRRNQLLLMLGGLGVLIALFVLMLVWLGAFEAEESDDARIRALMQGIEKEINDHDWDDLLLLCDMGPEEAERWKNSVPRAAEFVVIDTMQPTGLISVPRGATEYAQDVKVIAHMQVPIAGNIRADAVDGTLYFVKQAGIWKLDLRRSAPTFPYLPTPGP